MSGGVDNSSVPLNAVWKGLWIEKTGWNHDDQQATASRQVIPLGPAPVPAQAGTAQSTASQSTTTATGGVDATLAHAGSNTAPAPTAPTSTDVPSSGSGSSPINGTGNFPVTPPVVTAPATRPTSPAPPTASGSTPPATASTVGVVTLVTPGTIYVVTSPATGVLGGLGAAQLVANLPDSLKPNSSIPFYYDPYTENQQLQQAALAQTGQASFISGLSYDNQQSIDDQQKAILYSNAIAWAEANHIQLGQALTDQQIAALDKPMLWYVEQTVPDPSCAQASTSCPTITALMPQVYLPSAPDKLTGGTISGNDVTLDFSTSIHNTGTVTANTLTVTTDSLVNEQRSVDIGKSAYEVKGGWMEYTGTQLAPGGFMAAVNLDVNANSINSIGDALKVLNPDGSVDQQGTQALLAQLSANLGQDFTQTDAHDDIHSNFIKKETGLGALGTIVVMIAISIMTMGAGAALVGAMGTTLTAGSLGAAIANAAVSSMIATAATGAINGNFSMEAVLKGGATAALTAGITNGVTYNADTGFDTVGWSANVADNPNTLANLAGTSNVSNGVVQASTTGATGTLGTQIAAMVGTSAISAGVSTIVNGGSFKDALTSSLVSNAAAVGAYTIGQTFIGDSALTGEGGVLHVASHALLGCAAASMKGDDCASGAIGGAVSAALLPRVGDALNLSDADKSNQYVTAGMTALSMLAGGMVAQSLGSNAVVAAGAAQNEVLNNYLTPKAATLLKSAESSCKATGDKNACSVATALKNMDAASRDQMDQLISACKGGSNDACMQAQQLVNSRNAIAKEQIDSCPAPYNCLAMYQPSAQENAAAARQLPNAGSGAIVPTMDPITAAILLRLGAMNPSMAAMSAGAGAVGESINQALYGDGSINFERIANAGIISWATGGASASLSGVYSVAAVGAGTNAVTTAYNNSQTGSNDSVLASALLGWSFSGGGKAISDLGGNYLGSILNYTKQLNPNVPALLQPVGGKLVPVLNPSNLPNVVKDVGSVLLPTTSAVIPTPASDK
jgi:filamentous hemagglutinin